MGKAVKIPIQIYKTCALEGCSQKFIKQSYQHKFCTDEHKTQAATNKRKVKRPNENFRRALKAGVILPKTEETVYEHYKEPLRKVKDGYGYYGTIASNKDRTHIQCHVCGYFFRSLASHITKHGINTRDYKEKFQLRLSRSLVSQKHREEKIARYLALPQEERKKVAERARKALKTRKKRVRYSGTYSQERKNEEGRCADQLIDKIHKLTKKMGRVPTSQEFREHYGGYLNSIRTTFGSWKVAVERAGLKLDYVRQQRTYEELTDSLRNFYEKYNRTPTGADMRNEDSLFSPSTYKNHFGTLNNAREEAGIPKLIRMAGHGGYKWREG